MFFLKDVNIRGAKNKKCNQNAQKTVLLYVNSFWWPFRNPAYEIMALFFFSAYHFTPRSADVILVQAEATKSFAISLTYLLDHFH